MTDHTASCLMPGDVVLHKRFDAMAAVARVEPRSDAPGFWVVVDEIHIPQRAGTIGEPPQMYRCHPEDLDIVIATREM